MYMSGTASVPSASSLPQIHENQSGCFTESRFFQDRIVTIRPENSSVGILIEPSTLVLSVYQGRDVSVLCFDFLRLRGVLSRSRNTLPNLPNPDKKAYHPHPDYAKCQSTVYIFHTRPNRHCTPTRFLQTVLVLCFLERQTPEHWGVGNTTFAHSCLPPKYCTIVQTLSQQHPIMASFISVCNAAMPLYII